MCSHFVLFVWGFPVWHATLSAGRRALRRVPSRAQSRLTAYPDGGAGFNTIQKKNGEWDLLFCVKEWFVCLLILTGINKGCIYRVCAYRRGNGEVNIYTVK